jgi:hypothetical protein
MTSYEALPFPHPRNCPTRAEVVLHKNEIEIIKKDMINIESKISRLRTRLRYLQQRKANHVSYIAPLRRLPPEILSEIVLMCLNNGVKLKKLMQVCGTLREVATGMSTLWNKILLLAVNPQKRYNETTKTWVITPFFDRLDAQGQIDTSSLQNSRAAPSIPQTCRVQTVGYSR